MKADIRQGIFGRWFLFDPNDPSRTWSGSRWVDCTANGVPIGRAQACNFESKEKAADYVAKIRDEGTRKSEWP